MTPLQRLSHLMSQRQLVDLLDGTSRVALASLPYQADLTPLHEVVQDLMRIDGTISPKTDADFSVVVHKTLRHLPRKVLLDMRFWQWLAAIELPQYTILRWAPQLLDGGAANLGSGPRERFLGSQSLRGVARNSLSRLYWCAATMDDAAEDYALTRAILRNQDLYVGVFEREIGLLPNVARACARDLALSKASDSREALKRLMLRASTMAVEGLDEADVRVLLHA